MKWIKCLVVWVLGMGVVFGDGLPVEVRMLNGDLFTGGFQMFDGGYFEVKPGWGGENVRFHAAYTGSIRFSGTQTRREVHPSIRVRFVNGDQLSGRLLALSDEVLEMETLWGRFFTADRAFIKEVEILPGADSLIFTGFSPISDWSVQLPAGSSELASHTDEIFLPENGRISRTLPLPKTGGVLFEIELSFPKGETNTTLELFQHSRRGRPLEGMVLSLNPSWIHVRTVDANGRQNWVLREPLAPEAAHDRIEAVVYLNVQSAEVVLRLNDVEYPPFSLHTDAPLPGRENMELVLQAGRDSGGVDVHHVSFRRYPGVFAPDLSVEDPTRDVVVFRNGDRMEAGVVSMDPGGLSLRLEDQQLVEIPRERVRTVLLGTRPLIHPRRGRRDVEMHLAERGDRLTLALTGLDDGGFTGKSDIWKTLSAIPSGEIRKLRLNIYQNIRYDDRTGGTSLFLFER